MTAQRLFVAVDPPEVVRADLAALTGPIEGVSWTRPGQLHLTLRFIGDCEETRRERLEAALGRVRVESFILPVAGVGSFPPGRPSRILWAGLGGAHTRLFQLRQLVDEALLSVDTGLDVRRFQPHITLGRFREEADPKPVTRWLERHASFEGPPFRVAEFHLYASTLEPAGPVHARLRSFPLVAKEKAGP